MLRDQGVDDLRAVYKTAVFKDKDGSLGTGPGSFVVIHDGVNDGMADDTEACEIKPTWNAAVCKGDVGRLSFINGRGLAFGPISSGGGPAPASLPPVMDLDLIELDAGSWVILEIPGFTKAAAGQPLSFTLWVRTWVA